MPSSAARSGTRGLPPFGLGDSAGSNGPITSRNPSLTKASGIFRTSDPPKGLAPWLPDLANTTPASTTAPPAACQGPRASPRIAQASAAAIVGCRSRATEEKAAGSPARA